MVPESWHVAWKLLGCPRYLPDDLLLAMPESVFKERGLFGTLDRRVVLMHVIAEADGHHKVPYWRINILREEDGMFFRDAETTYRGRNWRGTQDLDTFADAKALLQTVLAARRNNDA